MPVSTCPRVHVWCDRFGQVMLDNLLSRGCVLAGAAACQDKNTQIQRFTGNGWDNAQCWNMNEVPIISLLGVFKLLDGLFVP